VSVRPARVLAVACVVAASLLAAGCSTTGRELPEPAMTTLPAGLAAASTTSAGAPTTPVEGLGGFALSSPNFVPGGELPADAGADTGNRSPALAWTFTPESAAELALVVTDETGGIIYWLVTGLVTTDLEVPAGTRPADGIEHASTAGPVGWSGPVAPAQGSAQVVFALYALNDPVVATEGETSHAVRERVIAASFATATIRATFSGTGGAVQPG
jgi:phosphatidylethanolamine-binding protein (PEBP) family uncharacterized protein